MAPRVVPVGAQGPPARSASSQCWALRSARGFLLCTTGTTQGGVRAARRPRGLAGQDAHFQSWSRYSRSAAASRTRPSLAISAICSSAVRCGFFSAARWSRTAESTEPWYMSKRSVMKTSGCCASIPYCCIEENGKSLILNMMITSARTCIAADRTCLSFGSGNSSSSRSVVSTVIRASEKCLFISSVMRWRRPSSRSGRLARRFRRHSASMMSLHFGR